MFKNFVYIQDLLVVFIDLMYTCCCGRGVIRSDNFAKNRVKIFEHLSFLKMHIFLLAAEILSI